MRSDFRGCWLALTAERYKKISFDDHGVERLLVRHFLDSFSSPPSEIVLDLDATDDPVHGMQEGRFFHGYYRHYCYLPLYVFCGGFLLGATLYTADVGPGNRAVEDLERIISQMCESSCAATPASATTRS